MDNLHRETRLLLLTTQGQLESLESAAKSSLNPIASFDVHQSFTSNIQLLSKYIYQLKQLISFEPSHRKHYWQARLRDLEDQINELRMSGMRCASRFRDVERDLLLKNENEEMLRRRGKSIDGTSGGGDTVVDFGVIDEGESLKRSGKGVDGVLEVGRGALEMLVQQRMKLRGAQGKLVGVLKGMGVSKNLIRQIERRDRADMLLLVVLMVSLLVVVLILWIARHFLRS